VSGPADSVGAVLEPTFPLRTARLDLRPYQPGDLDDVRVMQTREEVTRYLYWDVMTEDEVRESLAKKIGRVGLRNEGDGLNPVAVLRETGEVVGDAALFYASEAHRTGEVGFVLKPEFQGRGLATEMGAEMLRLGFEEAGLHRIIGRCDARNTGSSGVMERLGMRREAHLLQNEWVKGEWCDELDYALLDDEWRASRSRA
jgi:RimJ/RimL family protein N-acetyltransferase